MGDRVTLVRDSFSVHVVPEDVDRFKEAGYSEPKPKRPRRRKAGE